MSIEWLAVSPPDGHVVGLGGQGLVGAMDLASTQKKSLAVGETDLVSGVYPSKMHALAFQVHQRKPYDDAVEVDFGWRWCVMHQTEATCSLPKQQPTPLHLDGLDAEINPWSDDPDAASATL